MATRPGATADVEGPSSLREGASTSLSSPARGPRTLAPQVTRPGPSSTPDRYRATQDWCPSRTATSNSPCLAPCATGPSSAPMGATGGTARPRPGLCPDAGDRASSGSDRRTPGGPCLLSGHQVVPTPDLAAVGELDHRAEHQGTRRSEDEPQRESSEQPPRHTSIMEEDSLSVTDWSPQHPRSPSPVTAGTVDAPGVSRGQ
jgi:hypothetical protein